MGLNTKPHIPCDAASARPPPGSPPPPPASAGPARGRRQNLARPLEVIVSRRVALRTKLSCHSHIASSPTRCKEMNIPEIPSRQCKFRNPCQLSSSVNGEPDLRQSCRLPKRCSSAFGQERNVMESRSTSCVHARGACSKSVQGASSATQTR